VALGLSERHAVILLYGLAASFGGIAILGLKFDAFVVGIVVILAAVAILIFGIFLGQGHLYKDVTASTNSQEKKPGGFVYGTFVMHKRRAVEVLIDLCLFGAAFVAAFLFRFDGELHPVVEQRLLLALPLVIPIKLVTFWAFGLYRRVWDFVGVHDLVALAKAVVTSSLISIMALWGLTRLQGYSRTVFLLDGLLLLLFAAGARILFRVFQETLSKEATDARRLLVIGAGHEGALILREVRRDPDLGLKVVGFLDDDPDKWGRRIHGTRILGGTDLLAELSEQDRFDEVVIAIRSLTPELREELVQRCQVTGRPTRVMQSIASTFVH
jgi:UDP-GlcNAc:undecaprenyl-phosphate GlcNAc-1-phosphate transferase